MKEEPPKNCCACKYSAHAIPGTGYCYKTQQFISTMLWRDGRVLIRCPYGFIKNG